MRASTALLSLLLVVPVPVLAQAPVTPTQTIHLFDGTTMSNFTTWLVDDHRDDPRLVFTVVDQIDGAPAIRISGERWGGIATRERYRDYRLVVEFRWGLVTWGNRRNAARDSGVLVHCQGPDGNTGADGNGPWMRSIEAQIIEGGVGDIILVAGFDTGQKQTPTLRAKASRDRDGEAIYDPQGELRTFETGRINWWGRDVDWQDRLGFRGRQDVESANGGWTRLEVVAKGDTITTLVNGQVVNAGDQASLTEGRIMIQSEGAEVYVRKIDLEPLK